MGLCRPPLARPAVGRHPPSFSSTTANRARACHACWPVANGPHRQSQATAWGQRRW
jgi:hypothetical protein